MVPLTFVPGSGENTEVCTTLSAIPDDVVEGDEEFTVILSLTTTGPSLSIGNNVTTVTIVDSDGNTDGTLT